MQTNIVKIVKSFKIASLVLFVALTGAQTLNAGSFGKTPARGAELETATEAKRALANLGSQDFKRVKDARLREAAVRALDALKAVARNTSKAREAALVAEFARSIGVLKGLPQPTAMSLQMCDESYKRCAELCRLTGANCDLCGISQNGCYLNELAAAIAHEGDPSK
jgi:hypothetical protein